LADRHTITLRLDEADRPATREEELVRQVAYFRDVLDRIAGHCPFAGMSYEELVRAVEKLRFERDYFYDSLQRQKSAVEWWRNQPWEMPDGTYYL
jgi:hypothetical protein